MSQGEEKEEAAEVTEQPQDNPGVAATAGSLAVVWQRKNKELKARVAKLEEDNEFLEAAMLDRDQWLGSMGAEIRILKRRCGLDPFKPVQYKESEFKKDQEEKPPAPVSEAAEESNVTPLNGASKTPKKQGAKRTPARRGKSG